MIKVVILLEEIYKFNKILIIFGDLENLIINRLFKIEKYLYSDIKGNDIYNFKLY